MPGPLGVGLVQRDLVVAFLALLAVPGIFKGYYQVNGSLSAYGEAALGRHEADRLVEPLGPLYDARGLSAEGPLDDIPRELLPDGNLVPGHLGDGRCPQPLSATVPLG